MMSEDWIKTAVRAPVNPDGTLHPVQVLGVIAPATNVYSDKPHIDIVAYWPGVKQWTVTHQCATDEDATDTPCTVLAWQPLDFPDWIRR